VTFAAVVSLFVGAYYILVALTEFSNSYWFYNDHALYVYDLAGQHLFWWGIFDSIIAALAIAAGISIWRGGAFGLVMGLSAAGFSAIRWLFYITWEPWLAITIIAIDFLVIYGLCYSADYFDAMNDLGP
jgi:hypothetical protein